MRRKACLWVLAVGFAGNLFIGPALGATYPTKPVEILIPYGPGSPTDLVSRLVADIAPKYLGQPLVPVNKPGAGGSLAAADVISSKPDGYKLMTTTNHFFATTTKTQKVPFDPNMLSPLVNFLELKDGTCVRSDSQWKTFNDLLDWGRKNPGKLRWAHTGRGASAHIALLLMFRRAGVEAIDIPYKGTPEKAAALLGGHVDASTMTYSTVVEHVKAGKIRFLVFNSDHQYTDPPGVPRAQDLGFTDVSKMIALVGLYIHRDTPEEIKRTLVAAFKKTYEDPEFKKKIIEIGEEPRFEGPEFLKDWIKKSEEVALPILKELGLYVGK